MSVLAERGQGADASSRDVRERLAYVCPPGLHLFPECFGIADAASGQTMRGDLTQREAEATALA